MTLEPGSTLGSQLRLVEPLSAGGLGTIWRAAHLGLGADVAVKVMSEQIKASPVAAIRFKEEARATAQIRHPNVLRVFDRGVTDDGDAYIVMELLVGESLRERLARGPLTVEETIHVVVQIAKGLEAAHRCQVVHRDLKPANVFLCEDDELPFVKILDFGIAK
ncbi:MAG: serine/threonine protein kinase, partial [Myxococcales bacterium]|nr:serine/threonine protein kinase [Myxococcales bacterium]